jgi:hypothetical protein
MPKSPLQRFPIAKAVATLFRIPKIKVETVATISEFKTSWNRIPHPQNHV